MQRAGEVLEAEARPVRLDDERHEYNDKFLAAESTTKLAISAARDVLEKTFDGKGMLKFTAVETCNYVNARERTVKGPKITVAEQKKGSWTSSSKETTTQVSTKVTEHVWKHELSYKASVVDKKTRNEINVCFERSCKQDLVTTSKDHRPKPERKEHPETTFDVQQLLDLAISKIDRTTAKTPRRNDHVDKVLTTLNQLSAFCRDVKNCFGSNDVKTSVFSPATCCFLMTKEGELNMPVQEPLLKEMRRTLSDEREKVRRTWTVTSEEEAKTKLLGPDEGDLLYCLSVLEQFTSDFQQAVQYLESLLRQQLDAAIGKELTAEAFDEYALYHDRLLFSSEFRPAPFSYAVRRSQDAFPDGTVSITKQKEPIRTFTRDATDAVGRYKFAIGAATYVEFDGPRYAHAYVARTFGGSNQPGSLELVAKARPFSAFVLLLGKVASKDEFLPEHAVIVQSSDEVVIPILLQPLPTPKEFADAIESLSPEQREFCEAFRKMQLASSLFGVVVVQLKPAIERVLNLPAGALLKEIQLTDHLMDLFIAYQIPTDMLSYDGPADADKATKISAVKAHVAAIRTVIQDAKDADLKKAKEASQYRKFEADSWSGECDEDDDASEAGMAHADLMCMAEETMAPMKMAKKKVAAMPLGGIRRGRAAGGMPPPPAMRSMAASMIGGGGPPPVPMAAPGSGPRQQQQQQQQPQDQPREEQQQTLEEEEFEEVESLDLTKIPQKLDANFKILDTDSQLRPTTLKTGETWTRTRKTSIIAEASKTTLRLEDLAKEKSKAFDLIDALSRSGALTLTSAELHVMVCATHAFSRSITDTLIIDNVDPILKAERASLIIATTLHDKPALNLVDPKKLPSLVKSSPFLLPEHLRSSQEQLPEARPIASS